MLRIAITFSYSSLLRKEAGKADKGFPLFALQRGWGG